MSTSLVSATLLGPPPIHHGFWYSQGFAGLPQGYLLTLDTFWFTVINLALGILVAWSISTLWRMACAVVFGIFYSDQLTWEESQNMTLIVNSPSAIEAFLASGELLIHRRKVRESPQRSKAKITLATLAVVSIVVISLNLGFPTLIALIPTSNQGLIVPRDCGVNTIWTNNSVEASDAFTNNFSGKNARWANAAFSVVDRNGSDANADSKNPSVTFPKFRSSYVNSCPDNVPACSPDHPFTLATSYTLSRQHFALNIDIPFSLQVSDTCYRPIQATGQLPGTNPNVTAFGLYYGPITLPTSRQEFTEMTFAQRKYSAGYTVSQYAALANPIVPSYWSPNSTLLMGGDTTLLLYYLGPVFMAGASTDPMFVTVTTPYVDNLYDPLNLVVPMVCDTKYVFCADGKHDCSPLGGLNTIINWTMGRQGGVWDDLRELLVTTLVFPPIYAASLGSSAIKASETTKSGIIQYDPQGVTAQKELGRLVSAGMVLIASSGQLSASGYWSMGNGSSGLDTRNPKSICKNSLMDSSKINTIPVLSYTLLLVFLLLIVLVGKIQLWPRKRLSAVYRNLLEAWALHTPGQLHREVTERIRGRFKNIDSTTAWPTVDTYNLGPAVVTQDNTKRFGSIGYDDKLSSNNSSPNSILTKSPSDFAPQYSPSSFDSTPTVPYMQSWGPPDHVHPAGANVTGVISVSYRTSGAGNVASHPQGHDSWNSQRSHITRQSLTPLSVAIPR